jgi:hypothetical protein
MRDIIDLYKGRYSHVLRSLAFYIDGPRLDSWSIAAREKLDSVL